ncbi:MAG: MFS transporter [Chloroflexi bacterium]|nr:MFS transporter [Chloroflexota bacterium]
MATIIRSIGLPRNNFWILWGSTTASNLADGLFKISLPILAAGLTQSPGLVAGVTFAITLPWPLLALHAGALADRYNRRNMMITANLLRVVVLSTIVLFVATKLVSIWMLYGCALLLGIAETFADTAAMSLIPSIVQAGSLEKANARLVATQTLTNEFIGPSLGGLLTTVGVALTLGLSSGLYALAMFFLLGLVGVFRSANVETSSISADIIEGLHYLAKQRLLRTLTLIVGVMAGCWSAWLAILVVYVVEPGPVGLDKWGYGLLLAGIGVGGVIGAMIVNPITQQLGRRWAIGMDILGTFIMMLTPAITTNPILIGTAAIIGGMGGTMWSVVVATLRQNIVPDYLLGRVSGAMRLVGWRTLPIGAALAGIIAQTLGVRAVFALGAGVTFLLFIPFFRIITDEVISTSLSQT